MDSHPLPSRSPLSVAALYRFTGFADCESLRTPLESLCRELGVRGTLLLAPEGINGTIAGPREAMDRVLEHISTLPDCADLDVKFSTASTMPFDRLKVRIKREIVTMGEPGIDPRASAGTYVEPEDWNALIRNPDTIVIDTRNEYEVEIGSFEGAIDPGTSSFREFPAWFRSIRKHLLDTKSRPRVAMFCTGGIRCEKSTAFLKQEGIEDVFHLKGGILNYLETVPAEASLWRGECFVFDQRVAISHGLAQGSHLMCDGCGRPVSATNFRSPTDESNLRCSACASGQAAEHRSPAAKQIAEADESGA